VTSVIRVENLGKMYSLGRRVEGGAGYRRFSEDLLDALQRPFRSLVRRNGSFPSANGSHSGCGPHPSANGKASAEDFWALRHVSFEVPQGEVLGIIGRNGAGKSTLLKVLSRITEPSEGRVAIRGRVASLLEVGTGFHPELTGRENVYLNGAVLGMSRAEIRRKFDEIVAFAGVERFLDTPVKRYSSGMYVRLAFAVAAHLEPEILIVDEVLSVGDAEFQKKCLGKMNEVSRAGRTVLFVSHQIATVARLCRTALWLDDGQIREYGEVDGVCGRYLQNGSGTACRRVWESDFSAPGNEWVRLECVEAVTDGDPAERVDIKAPVDIRLQYSVLKGGKVLIPNIHLYSDDGTLLFIAHDWHSGWRTRPKPVGRYCTTFTLPGNFFGEGRISVKVAVSTYRPFEIHLVEPDAIAFAIVESVAGESARGDYAGHLPGAVRPMITSETLVLD
jgi:lipopolysaccharide transport system ATP-binding protein